MSSYLEDAGMMTQIVEYGFTGPIEEIRPGAVVWFPPGVAPTLHPPQHRR